MSRALCLDAFEDCDLVVARLTDQGTSGGPGGAPAAATEEATMDEFARLMSMEGVRPIEQPKEQHAA